MKLKNEWLELLIDKSSNSQIVVSALGENNTIKAAIFLCRWFIILLVVDYDYGKPNPSKKPSLCLIARLVTISFIGSRKWTL